jgi:hypothetical protein
VIKLHKGLVYLLCDLTILWLGAWFLSIFSLVGWIVWAGGMTYILLLAIFTVLAIHYTLDKKPTEYFEIDWSQE